MMEESRGVLLFNRIILLMCFSTFLNFYAGDSVIVQELRGMKTYLPFNEARAYVRSQGFYRTSDFREWSKTKRPSNIPSAPNQYYKDIGWVSWMDWLGNDDRQQFGRKYEINHQFFSQWSYDMAYVFGFWFADGCIYKRGSTYRWNISQNRKGQKLLEEIQASMDSTYPIYPLFNDNNCQIRIDSQLIAQDIFRLGGKERKSEGCPYPSIPSDYLSSFVRGYFDGDGSVFVSKKQLIVDIVFADFSFAKAMREDICGQVSASVHCNQRSKSKYSDIKCYSSNAEIFCEWIYSQEGLKMQRKFDIYQRHMEAKHV